MIITHRLLKSLFETIVKPLSRNVDHVGKGGQRDLLIMILANFLFVAQGSRRAISVREQLRGDFCVRCQFVVAVD